MCNIVKNLINALSSQVSVIAFCQNRLKKDSSITLRAEFAHKSKYLNKEMMIQPFKASGKMILFSRHCRCSPVTVRAGLLLMDHTVNNVDG